MHIEIYAQCYNVYGSHQSFAYIGDFLLGRDRDFGSALSEIEVTFHFQTSGPPKKTLEDTYDQFHRNMASLPKVTFRKKKRQMAITIASELLDGANWKQERGLKLDLFCRAVPEVIGAIELCGKRLKKSDDFRLNELLSACIERAKQLPRSQEELDGWVSAWNAQRKAEREAMSPWEQLGLDWGDFHPDARSLVDTPFFWECGNDFAPNGNDTGADVLADFAERCKDRGAISAVSYLDDLAKSWGYTGASDMDEHVRAEAQVALVFAEMKINGQVFVDSIALARQAISAQRAEAEASVGWQHRENRIESLKRISDHLDKVANKALERDAASRRPSV